MVRFVFVEIQVLPSAGAVEEVVVVTMRHTEKRIYVSFAAL
jgi:hypothetical protein